jgi:hypothetical protein
MAQSMPENSGKSGRTRENSEDGEDDRHPISSHQPGWRTLMKALLTRVLFVTFLVIIPIALVSLPATAVNTKAEVETYADPSWIDCGISLECLR